MTPIQFGTDGWRALVAEEFTFPNVRRVAQATAEYLKAHPAPGRLRTVIVGYDTRPLGDRFAQAVAEVLAANGFPVLITQGPMPTPAVSLAIRQLRLSGGVLITASHNPFTYNGFKFRPFYAGSAEPAMTRWIEERLSRVKVRQVPFQEGIRSRKIRLIDLRPRYLSFLRHYVDWPVLKRARFRVAYDSMCGAGQDLLQRLVEGTRIEVIPVQKGTAPLESGHRPEPVGEQLQGLSLAVRKGRCHVGLATDGDSDRAGVVDSAGRFISSQETMSLLLWHLLEDRSWRGMVVTTVAGTNIIEAIAADYHVPFRRTPVGFKYIAKLMRSRPVLFGGEESGGFGFRGFVPERDGLLAGLLVLEMMAMRGKGLAAILTELRDRFGHWVSGRGDLTLERPMDPKVLLRWAKSGAAGRLKLGAKIRQIQTLDGVKLILEDGAWLLLRLSGTEPLLRVYGEGKSRKQLAGLIRSGQRIGRQIVEKE